MILHQPRQRPQNWSTLVRGSKHGWMVPFITFEWMSEWGAYLLSNWRFLEVLERLGSFSVLAAVIFYFSESGNRIKQRHYQAWQVINTAQGKGGSGGRIEALQELNADKVPLVGVDVSSAFLQGLKLEHADLLRSDFSAADLRGSDLKNANFTSGNLRSANFRGSDLENITFERASLKDADLSGSNLSNSKFDDADLAGADLSSADLSNIEWKNLRNVTDANVDQVKNPPGGFVQWALQHGAIQKGVE
jgi:uncharacterized protein YjbI with pentapeptide repeats